MFLSISGIVVANKNSDTDGLVKYLTGKMWRAKFSAGVNKVEISEEQSKIWAKT